MGRRTKTLAFFAVVAISSVLTFGDVVHAQSESEGFTAAREAVETMEEERQTLEEKRNKLLGDYSESHRVIKAVEGEILALAKKYPPLVTKAHKQLKRDIRACDSEIAKCLVQGMKRTGTTVTELESQKQRLEQLLKQYPLNVAIPKTYEEVPHTFSRVTEEMLQQSVTHSNEWKTFPGRRAGDLREIEINGVSYRFRWAPPGSFMMGSPETEEGRDDDEVLHKVTLSSGFWMLETEVTQSMWESIMGDNPSYFKGVDLPVDRVSWNECQEFIASLNDLGFAPAGACFSLPTESQWEYACRAGTTTSFSWGGTLNGDKANCDGERPYGTDVKGKCLGKTSPVSSYDANSWGLFDMPGNVWEWCEDWYGDYSSGPVTDPRGPVDGLRRVLRGGCWHSYAQNCRSALRNCYDVDGRYGSVGFRLTLVPNNK